MAGQKYAFPVVEFINTFQEVNTSHETYKNNS